MFSFPAKANSSLRENIYIWPRVLKWKSWYTSQLRQAAVFRDDSHPACEEGVEVAQGRHKARVWSHSHSKTATARSVPRKEAKNSCTAPRWSEIRWASLRASPLETKKPNSWVIGGKEVNFHESPGKKAYLKKGNRATRERWKFPGDSSFPNKLAEPI